MNKSFNDFLAQLSEKDWMIIRQKINKRLYLSEENFSDFGLRVANCTVIIIKTLLQEYHNWLHN
jgi:hypothetical protein